MGNQVVIANKIENVRSDYRNRTDEVYSSFDIKHLDFYPKNNQRLSNIRSDYRNRTDEVYSSFDIKHLDFYPKKSENLATLLLAN
jgi:hypothetical protein